MNGALPWPWFVATLLALAAAIGLHVRWMPMPLVAGILETLALAWAWARFTDGRSFVWIRKVLSPEQMQLVHEIGDPGLLFGPREMRLYPNGTLAAHVLGGTSFGAEGVHSAEVIGTAGVEKALDARLRDPAFAQAHHAEASCSVSRRSSSISLRMASYSAILCFR